MKYVELEKAINEIAKITPVVGIVPFIPMESVMIVLGKLAVTDICEDAKSEWIKIVKEILKRADTVWWEEDTYEEGFLRGLLLAVEIINNHFDIMDT